MTETCPVCHGNKYIKSLILYCPNCGKEIPQGSYERISTNNMGNPNYDIINAYCQNPNCSGEETTLNRIICDFPHENTVSVCEHCSKDLFSKVADLDTRLIQGHFPKNLWDVTTNWYSKFRTIPSLMNYYNNNGDIISTITNFDPRILDIYNIIWLKGSNYSGITALAICLAKKLMEKSERKAYFISMHKLIERSKDFEDKNYIEDIVYKNDIILIDDFFTNGKFFLKSDYNKVHVYNFLKEVILNKKIIICTSNIAPEDIHSDFSAIKEILLPYTKTYRVSGNLTKVMQEINQRKEDSLSKEGN